MINLTPRVINIEYTIFMHTHCIYLQKIQSIWLSFQVRLQVEKVNSSLLKLLSFFGNVFLRICFYWSLSFPFWFFLFIFNLIFASFGYLYLVLLQLFLPAELVMISDFPLRQFVRLTNLETFKIKTATLLYIFSSPPVLTINSLIKSYLETLNFCKVN